MKQVNNYRRTVQYLQKIFNLINDEYFDGKLPEVTVSLQESMRAYGSITTSAVWFRPDSDEGMKELNISANYVGQRGIEFTVTTLIHEACHLYCAENGIKDTSGNYHNQRFKAVAESLGRIRIEKHEKYGFTLSYPTDETLEFCIKYGLDDIQINRDGFTSIGRFTGGTTGNGNPEPPKQPKKKSSTRKYICECCSQTVRATKEVNIICGNCMVPMVPAE